MKFPKKEKNKSWGQPKNQERVVPKKARRAKLKEWEKSSVSNLPGGQIRLDITVVISFDSNRGPGS